MTEVDRKFIEREYGAHETIRVLLRDIDRLREEAIRQTDIDHLANMKAFARLRDHLMFGHSPW